MSSVDERLGTLEANDKALFHQVDELKEEVRDIRRLTIAIEKIAGKVTGDSTKTIYFEVSPLEYGLWTAGSGS